jgi:hypothetical protein
MGKLTPRVVGNTSSVWAGIDVLVLAAGFEERAFQVLSTHRFNDRAHVILVLYDNDVPGNPELGKRYRIAAEEKFLKSHIHRVQLHANDIDNFKLKCQEVIRALPSDLGKFGIDVSGMPAHVIFALLNLIREAQPYEDQICFYTAAREYTPTEKEYEELKRKQGDDIEYVPKSMALEMSQLLVFEPFSGYRSGDARCCLALFAGYELHRSTGVVDEINPAVTLLMYGKPASEKLAWRLDLSRRLHQKFEKTRRCAVEEVSTRDVGECMAVLEEYYNFTVDDYDLTIAPVCSKMQTIASFLFWEKYPEVQVTFPLPIGYDPDRRPRGVESTYALELPGRLTFPQRNG